MPDTTPSIPPELQERLDRIRMTHPEPAPEMVAEVERRVSEEPGAIDYLRERLMVAGYAEAHAGQYSRRFEPKEKRMLSVSEGFPRLTPGVVPACVTRAVYEINLDHAGDFLSDLGVALKKLGATG